MDEFDISIIVVNYNVPVDVLKCIRSIFETTEFLNYEVIIVDNNSNIGATKNFEPIADNVKTIRLDSNRGFGYACNFGMKSAKGKYILLANPDIVFEKGSINKLFDFMESETEAGVVGPMQIKPGIGIERYYTFFPSLYSRTMQENRLYMTAPIMKYRFNEFLDENIRNDVPFKVDWVMGSCMLTRRKIFETLGGFDEAFFLFEEETEWQYRMSKFGWKSYILPQSSVLHDHHSSTSKLGDVFVHYHEFRSRLIFDSKRFKGIEYIVRRLQIALGLFLRIALFKLKSVYSELARQKCRAFYDLWLLSIRNKEKILQDRYNFDEKYQLFKS